MRPNRKLSHMLPAILAAFTLAICSGCNRKGSVNKYETAPVSRGDIVQHVTASGTLSAVVSVDVGSQVSGKITALYADFNSPVKKTSSLRKLTQPSMKPPCARPRANWRARRLMSH